MPYHPLWFPKLSRIIADLEAVPALYLDRHAIEKAFGVSQRRARQLMTGLRGVRIGNAHAVEKAAVLAFLRNTSTGVPFRQETLRRQRLADRIVEARKLHAGRAVQIRNSPPQAESLPNGVTLSSGELRIRYDSGGDLASKLYALAQTMATDWATFQSWLS